MLPYGRQTIDESDIQAVVDVLRSDWITQGPTIERFEHAVAKYVGSQYAVAFCNGTAALHGACYAAGIGPGDEVITTPITFLASSNSVLYLGGRPVFADIKPDTYNIDPDRIQELVNPHTRAIIAVDFTGQPAEMDRIRELADKYNLIVIEDAAHALGASYHGRKVGSLADMTMFSFHPVKPITTGEGGMIVTNNEKYYRRLLLFRNHGMTREMSEFEHGDAGPWYYEMHTLGYNYRMTDIHAALGISQLSKLDQFIELRRDIARTYDEAFSGMDGLVIPYQHPKAESSWHLYVLRWQPEHFRVSRREIFETLRARNIGVNVHYIPIYRQPYYRKMEGANRHFPISEAYYESAISLPIFPEMTVADVSNVIEAVNYTYQLFLIK